MAKSFGLYRSANTDSFYRTTDLPSPLNYTMATWVRLNPANPRYGSWRSIFSLAINFQGANHDFEWNSSNALQLLGTGGSGVAFSTNPSPLNWHYVWMRCAGTGANQQEAGWATMNRAFVKVAKTITDFTPNRLYVGTNDWDEWIDGQWAHFRVWKRVLTDTELYSEMYSQLAISRNALDTDIVGGSDLFNRGSGGQYTITDITAGSDLSPIAYDDLWIPTYTVVPAGPSGITITVDNYTFTITGFSLTDLNRSFYISNVIPSTIYEGLVNIQVQGHGFGASQANSKIFVDDVEQTVNTWSASLISFDFVKPNTWASPRNVVVKKIP